MLHRYDHSGIYLFQKIHYIISRFRNKLEDGPLDRPTPSEFIRSVGNLQNLFTIKHKNYLQMIDNRELIIRYILEDVKNHDIQSLNDHWQPLHKCCPFCYLHFRSSILFVSIKRHYYHILYKIFQYLLIDGGNRRGYSILFYKIKPRFTNRFSE